MNQSIKTILTTTLLAGAFILTGCQSGSHHHGRHARAELNPTANNKVQGTVDFFETAKGVRVVAKVSGLTPGLHGFHIHEKGDCSEKDGTAAGAAGGHFNPGGMKHGGPTDAMRHAGDFGNITADASGNATYEAIDAHITFDGMNSIIGRGVIVHANADDLSGQPAGNAGPRVACGVILMH